MSNQFLSELGTLSGAEFADKTSRRPKRIWLVVVWMCSTIIGAVGWWAGLALAAVWLIEHAVS